MLLIIILLVLIFGFGYGAIAPVLDWDITAAAGLALFSRSC
jgi:hypothetical protein